MADLQTDWSPETYGRFRGFRLRPALDLLAQVGDLPAGEVVDLGCGDGAVAGALRAHWPQRRLIGVDSSPAMLAKAKGYDRLEHADIADWQGAGVALIFSNAALHWLPDHPALLPRLAGMLAPGGLLAVQMPGQFQAPSHRLLRDIAAVRYPDRFDFAEWQPPVSSAVAYWALLAPLGEVQVWETTYIQRLTPSEDAHPVRRFTESTAMRPFLERLDADEAARFISVYDQALAAAYPALEDGAVLFPFRRVFFTLRV